MKSRPSDKSKRKDNPIILFFFRGRSLEQIRAYKLKSQTLSLAMKEKLCVKLVAAETKEHVIECIKSINGSFYGILRKGNQLVEKRININNISKVVVGSNGLQIIYEILW